MLSSETYRPGREEMSTDDGLGEGGNEDSSNMLTHALVGEPRGKAKDPLIHLKGIVTLLQQLGRKAHVHAPTRDED